jgi:hypothetical protein
LNATTSEKGSIVVELLWLDGKQLAKSLPITGDDLRHKVAWESSIDLASLAGKPIVLRFAIADAQLYSFAFRK